MSDEIFSLCFGLRFWSPQSVLGWFFGRATAAVSKSISTKHKWHMGKWTFCLTFFSFFTQRTLNLERAELATLVFYNFNPGHPSRHRTHPLPLSFCFCIEAIENIPGWRSEFWFRTRFWHNTLTTIVLARPMHSEQKTNSVANDSRSIDFWNIVRTYSIVRELFVRFSVFGLFCTLVIKLCQKQLWLAPKKIIHEEWTTNRRNMSVNKRWLKLN